jgi:RHS repeat-associated protein
MHLRPIALLAVILGLTSSASRASTIVPGSLPGDVTVDNTGGVSYSIPIEIPAGTAGMQPDLALNYSNQSGNGPFGVGWSVSGLSSITRGPTMYARDGFSDGVDFDSLDKFYLDGQRLVKVAHSTAAPWFVEYRTELESFSRIRSYGSTLDAATTTPSYWTVETKAGLKMWFGADPDGNQGLVSFSRMEDGNSMGGTIAWQIVRVQDTRGNHFDYRYKTDSTCGNTLLIDQILYTANAAGLSHFASVNFVYEDQVRTDTVRSGFFGFKSKLCKRVNSIVIKSLQGSSPAEISRYDLGYEYNQATLSRIKTITLVRKSGSDEVALKPTTFSYSDGVQPLMRASTSGIGSAATPYTLANGSLGTWSLDNPPQFYSADLNGDAKAELIKQQRTDVGSGIKKCVYQAYTPGSGSSSFTASGSSFSFVDYTATMLRNAIGYTSLTSIASDSQLYESVVFSDFNMDGRTDAFVNSVMVAHVTTNGNYWKTICLRRLFLRTNVGGWQQVYDNQSTVTTVAARDSARASWEYLPADIDGDGSVELVHFDPEPVSGKVRVSILKTSNPASTTFFDKTVTYVKDMAGNYLDIALGSGWDMRAFLMDHDGDGTSDIATYTSSGLTIHMMSFAGADSGETALGTIRNWPSGLKGSTSSPFIVSFTSSQLGGIDWDSRDTLIPADLDGDGREDLIRVAFASGKILTLRLPLSGADTFNSTPPWIGSNPPATIRTPYEGEVEAWATTVSTETANGLRDTVGVSQLNLPCGTPSQIYALNVVPFDANGDGILDLIVGYNVKNSSNTLSSGTALFLGSAMDSQRGSFNLSERDTQRGSGYGCPTSMSDSREFVDSLTFFDSDSDGFPELLQFRKQTGGSNIEFRRWELYSSTIPVVNTNACPWANLLYDVKNGYENETKIVYLPMTDSTVYTRLGSAPTFPLVEVFGPMPLVSSVGRQNSDSTFYWSTYGYTGCLAHVQGRGSLGFASVVSYDWDTGVAEYKNLEQAFPFTGSVNETIRCRWLSAGGLTWLSQDENKNSFDVVAFMDGETGASVFPMVVKSTSRKWEDDNAADYDSENKWIGKDPYSVVTSKTWFDSQNLSADPPERTDFSDPIAQAVGSLTYGNIRKIVIDSGDDFITTTINEYEAVNPYGTWILGRLKNASATSAATGKTSVTRRSAFKYDASGLLSQEFIEPAYSGETITGARTIKSYYRDAYGNIEREAVTGAFGARNSANSYVTVTTLLVSRSNLDTTGRFFQTTQNSLGHVERSTFDFWGRKLSSTGPNGLVTQGSYSDLFGTHVIESRPDGTVAESNVAFVSDSVRTAYANEASPDVSVTYVKSLPYTVKTSSASGSPEARVYYDRFGREIRSEVDGFNGAVIRKDTLYDHYSRPVAVSGNYYADSNARPAFGDLPDFSTSQWARSEYDTLGRVSKVIAPNGSETRYVYNGRVSKVIADAQSGGKQQTQTTLVNAIGKTVKVWNADRDTSGISQLGTGASGSPSLEFTYDAIGNLIQTVADNATTTMSYDNAGNKIAMNDADMGAWSYEYDAIGRLRFQTDAKGQTTQMSYDVLGRLQKRVTRESGNGAYEVTRWEYDGTGEFDWIGAIRREYVMVENQGSASADVLDSPTAAQIRTQHGYQYDELGRQIIDLRQVDGKWYYNYTRYDSFGRVSTVNYFWRPSGLEDTPSSSAANWQSFGLTYTYTSTGFLTAITDHQNRCWWDSPTYDQQGRVIQARKGTVWTRRDYRETDGSLASIKSGFSAGDNTLQDLAYAFDNLGNLTQRADAYRTHQGTGSPTTALSETFAYDTLNRLTTRSGATVAAYAANGNILWKKDVAGTGSNFTYGAKPHAVTGAFDYTIGYDANGLMSSRTKTGQTTPWSFTWTRSNMVKWIFDGLDGSEYEYDGSDARIREIRKVSGQEVEKKIFCPGFEQFFDKNATTGAWKAKLIRVHIAAPDGLVGTYEYRPNQANMAAAQTLTLLFTDHLGSVDLAINIAGSTLLNFGTSSTRQKYSYDPWGERRNEATWSGAHVLTATELAAQHTDRGFTGHEMLDELGLINMNARLYDPQLGRFLSADSIVQNAGDLQSYNRYSYCGNNPLCRIDPSGHSWLSSAAKGIGNFVSKYWKTIVVIIVTVIVAYFTAGAAAGWVQTWGAAWGTPGVAATASAAAVPGTLTTLGSAAVGAIGGAAAGFAGGFLGCALSGGGLGSSLTAGLTGAAWGALSGAAAGAIGGPGAFGHDTGGFWHEVARAAAHGVSSGVIDDLRGGKFAAGFASGFFSSAATHGLGIDNWKNIYAGAAAAAVIGGTASVIGGGKFENGAMYGAFQYLYNAVGNPSNGPPSAKKPIVMRQMNVTTISDPNCKGAYTEFGFSVTETNAEIIIEPLANITVEAGLSAQLNTLVMADELEHVADFQCYLDGKFGNELYAITQNSQIINSVNRAQIIQANLVGRANAVAIVSGKFWDTPHSGSPKYHEIYRQTATTAPQPNQSVVDAYRLNAFGSM